MVEPVALTALAIDAAIGWPRALHRRIGHPVGLFARFLNAAEARWNGPRRSFAARRASGIVTVVLLIGMVGGIAFAIQIALLARLGAYGWMAIALLAWPGLAQRSLFDHVRPIAQALDREDPAAARLALSRIVGRDTDRLDHAGIARATIESLAESFCDGVAAPLFWLSLFGLPGIWVYKAINTADSLIGHREPRWRAFGWAAARTDDLLNLVPARLSGVLLCLAGRGGWRTMVRDAGNHASPNAGWPEAAMAGALGLKLAGPIGYDGVIHDKPWIGDGSSDADARDVRRALAIYVGACLLLWILAGAFAWLR